MIPLLGVPILNGVDHLREMLSSIDVPVDKIVVIDNGDVVPDSVADHPEGGKPMADVIIKPGFNLGVAASWNWIIKGHPQVSWWVISNHDIIFSPGDLERLATAMSDGGVVMLGGGFSVFALTSDVIDRVGWFDENYAPAYFEDNDFDYRCRLAGVNIRSIPSGMQHRTSSTLREDPDYRAQNSGTFASNRERYLAKWGGPPYMEKFTTPFDAGGDIRDCRLDINRLRAQRWIRAVDR